MDPLRNWAETKVNELAAKSPPALELARLASPAVRLEPELLRALRLALLPWHGPTIEADLWFSPLVRSRSATGIVLDPAVAELLRGQLAEQWREPDGRRVLAVARAVMAEVHRNLSPALALEERVAWAGVAGDIEEINDELARALKALLTEQRPGLNAWANQALNRLPSECFETEAGQALRQLTQNPPSSTPPSDPSGVLNELPLIRLGVRRLGGRLEIGQLEPRARHAIRLPDSTPRLVRVLWSEGGVQQSRRLSIPAAGVEVVEVGDGPVRLRNALRQEFAAPLFGRWDGPPPSWTRVEITPGEGWSGFMTTWSGEHARGQASVGAEQRRSAEELTHTAVSNADADEAWPQALSELLVPSEWRSLDFLGDCQLALEGDAAHLPWELLRTNPEDPATSLALAGQVVRLGKVGTYEPRPGPPSPDVLLLDLTRSGDRPKASIPTEIAELLKEADLRFSTASGDPKEVLSRLFEKPYRALHILAEGPRDGSVHEPSIELGQGLFLTPRELMQLHSLPELIVLHDVAANAGRAAQWARSLLEIGVRAVLVNAWETEPEPARDFLRLFHRALLEGSRFAEAGLLARRETYRLHPRSLAWAAFQLHGDPEFRWSPAPISETHFDPPVGKDGTGLDLTLTLVRQADARAVPNPGLYRVRVNTSGASLEALTPGSLAGHPPILLLLHGLGGSALNAFPGLWTGTQASAWPRWEEAYRDRIVAFEHWTLSRSPIENALDLVEALPPGARLHVLSLSAGGLIGELLCRARRVNGPPIDSMDLKRFDATERKALKALSRALERKRPMIERFVRVACPARGTDFPKQAHQVFGKLSKALAFLGTVVGSFPLQLFETIADPQRVPGLRSMASDSPLIGLLNRPDVTVDVDLSIVAGTFRPGSLTSRMAAPVLNLFLGQENDLMVPTPSMFGGARRVTPARYVLFQGKEVTHFSYFNHPDVLETIADRLLSTGGGVGWKAVQEPTRPVVA